MKKEFMAIILGCDENTYGFARVMHEKYQIKPIALTTTLLEVCKYTKIIDIEVDPELHNPNHLINKLIYIGQKLKNEYKKLIVIPCSDFYMEILCKEKEKLNMYENKFIEYKLLKEFNDKKSFYQMCDKYSLPYPKTIEITPNDYLEKIELIDFPYPIILKPNNSNSIEYLDATFTGKEKVYIINSKTELFEKIKLIYKSSYQGILLIQKFIEGDDTNMRVLNVYSDKSGKVKTMSLCQPILEEYHPATFGNYAAIISLKGTNDLMFEVKKFLENIHFTGAANFDIKIDEKTRTYYLLEINPRPGRSSFVTTLGGASIQKSYIKDLIYDDLSEQIGNINEVLWLNVPLKLVKKYVTNKKILKKVQELKNNHLIYHTLKYKNDNSLKRKYIRYLQYMRKIHYYPKYFVEKK